jgi:hypothetical protein
MVLIIILSCQSANWFALCEPTTKFTERALDHNPRSGASMLSARTVGSQTGLFASGSRFFGTASITLGATNEMLNLKGQCHWLAKRHAAS